ncbi:uncharacterized protein LOC133287359 [Gastrolobium bilobum]|uniref:uncharacterized protein LOC133287359 n=1 Tax=Gastrolobium bilobum TaxID=150636 RepID=UPI002AB1ADE5|nr:uncharacterized protein LOC133287359 [Gastrolobium bilobum]
MDLPSHKFFQASSVLVPHGESPFEGNMSLYGKNKDNPFVDAFPDPLCKLNLRETSEFVKSFPMPNGYAESRSFLEVSAQRREGFNNNNNNNSVTQQRRLEAPPTPGRPVFSFSSSVGRNLSRKSFPSKWDDAEKWLMSTSCHDSPAHNNMKVSSESSKISTKQCDNFKHQMLDLSEKSRVTQGRVSKAVPNFQRSSSLDHHNSFGAFNVVSCPTDIVLKDKFTDSIEPILPNFGNQAGEAMQNACTEVIHDIQHRDVGTEMTPLGSSTTSRCHTPVKSSSPARHNTPASRSGPLALANPNSTACTVDVIQLEECHFSKLKLGSQYDLVTSNWSSSEEEEKEISKSLRHNASQKADSDCMASTWEEEEKTKCCLRYQREEARIQAWVNLQNAKAEARSRKLEVKIQKMRSNLEEKLMKKMSVVHRKAEEWRTAARQQHLEQIQKATEQAQKMIHRHNSQFSRHSACGCFPCNNNYN